MNSNVTRLTDKLNDIKNYSEAKLDVMAKKNHGISSGKEMIDILQGYLDDFIELQENPNNEAFDKFLTNIRMFTNSLFITGLMMTDVVDDYIEYLYMAATNMYVASCFGRENKITCHSNLEGLIVAPNMFTEEEMDAVFNTADKDDTTIEDAGDVMNKLFIYESLGMEKEEFDELMTPYQSHEEDYFDEDEFDEIYYPGPHVHDIVLSVGTINIDRNFNSDDNNIRQLDILTIQATHHLKIVGGWLQDTYCDNSKSTFSMEDVEELFKAYGIKDYPFKTTIDNPMSDEIKLIFTLSDLMSVITKLRFDAQECISKIKEEEIYDLQNPDEDYDDDDYDDDDYDDDYED